MVRKYIELFLMIIGLLSAIAGIFSSNKLFIYIFIVILVFGAIFILIKYLISREKQEPLPHTKHSGLYSMADSINKTENRDFVVTKLIKNSKYSDNNRTSNVTYIIDGKVTGNFCRGLFIPISAASLTSNIEYLKFSLILEPKERITHDDFQFIENSNKDILLTFDANYKVIESTPYSKKLFLPFATALAKGDTFQAILYYTWKNSIIDITDSTFYYTTSLFFNGVDKLITNLVFTSRPFDIAVYKAHKNKKHIISKVQSIKQKNNSFIIRWEIDNPEGTYLIQRTLEK